MILGMMSRRAHAFYVLSSSHRAQQRLQMTQFSKGPAALLTAKALEIKFMTCATDFAEVTSRGMQANDFFTTLSLIGHTSRSSVPQNWWSCCKLTGHCPWANIGTAVQLPPRQWQGPRQLHSLPIAWAPERQRQPLNEKGSH